VHGVKIDAHATEGAWMRYVQTIRIYGRHAPIAYTSNPSHGGQARKVDVLYIATSYIVIEFEFDLILHVTTPPHRLAIRMGLREKVQHLGPFQSNLPILSSNARPKGCASWNFVGGKRILPEPPTTHVHNGFSVCS
jgi:hypothetical protein